MAESKKCCVAGGCSSRKSDTVSLHSFPFDRPPVLRHWVQFVHNTRKNWSGPTKHSLLCSLHFSDDAYPAKYRMMALVGIPVKRRELEKDAVPTKYPQQSQPPPPLHSPLLCSTPKRPRRAFQKRETQRVSQHIIGCF
jgi:hypothetical protein